MNIRAILTSYYVGIGGYDIGSIANFFGLHGGQNWERSFNRHSPELHNTLLDLSQVIKEEALVKEVEVTIRETLKGKYSQIIIDEAVSNFIKGNYDNVPMEILTVGIAVFFDMGWQKRSTGRLYDSMSGHGYLIGCRTKNILGFGLKKSDQYV